MFLRAFSAIAAFALYFVVQSANAATYDAAADFDSASNPSGPWSYGTYSTMGDPGTFTTLAGMASLFGLGGFDGYTGGGAHIIAKNTNASAISPGTPIYGAGSLILHPSDTGLQAVVRWTAASAGTVNVKGGFFWTDLVGSTTTTDGRIFQNSSMAYAGAVNGGLGINAVFDFDLTVSAGDAIDFAVGWGADGNFFFDSTELSATITELSAVPLPAGGVLLLSGLGAAAALGRKKRAA